MNFNSIKNAIHYYILHKIQDFVNVNWLKYNCQIPINSKNLVVKKSNAHK